MYLVSFVVSIRLFFFHLNLFITQLYIDCVICGSVIIPFSLPTLQLSFMTNYFIQMIILLLRPVKIVIN